LGCATGGTSQHRQVIYGLTREDGKVFYVGRISNPKGRLVTHRSRFGDDSLRMVTLQDSFPLEEGPAAAERRWIRELLPTGLVNDCHRRYDEKKEAELIRREKEGWTPRRKKREEKDFSMPPLFTATHYLLLEQGARELGITG